ncbi:MBOAT family protein [Lentisphaerota bacterium WC36G]|nr:MBOAT family protein [Lentisphaerae bacterium WC36]
MLFNSYYYLVYFLPLTAIIYFFLNQKKLTILAKVWLLFASLFFYAFWEFSYLIIILGSVFFNYIIGSILNKIVNKKIKLIVLLFALSANISLLGYYKYYNFFIENINHFFLANIHISDIVLPLAISFFTFQQIAYLVDNFRGSVKANFFDYCLFVTFFPQLIAGPIVHYKETIPQFKNKRNKIIDWKNVYFGICILCLGLGKKILIADTLSPVVKNGFEHYQFLTFFESWLTSLSYTLQLYFDFSGYCDMAIGSALIFNIKLPVNFNSPYKAINIQDFWRRWHMTLSRWLKNYLYIPLGGNRKGNLIMAINLLLTFLIGGFWHGAGWTFIIWGALHGSAVIIFRVWQKFNVKLPKAISWLITFNFVNLAWVFFRAESIHQAWFIVKNMFSFEKLSTRVSNYTVSFFQLSNIKLKDSSLFMDTNVGVMTFIVIALTLSLCFNNLNDKSEKLTSKRYFFCCVMIFLYMLLSINEISEFIYFKF